MPTLEENRITWETYEWPQGGDEWSWEWGGVAAQWYGSLLPRIHRWVPAGTILEIAPGFGRWTQFLKDLGRELVVVDLSERCIDACRERFADAHNISYHVNDGRTLGMVADRSVDLAVSFDSLVHVEADVIESYLAELSRTLAPSGVGYIQHSNLGCYLEELRWGRRLQRRPWVPSRLQERLERSGRTTRNLHMRAQSVTAELVADLCEKVGLRCIGQELINWGGPILNDCFSAVTPVGSRWGEDHRVLRNREFMAEVAGISRREHLYRT